MFARTNLQSAYRVEDAAPQRRAGPLASLFLLQHAAPSRLWLGVGQLFRMVEQGQVDQLAMSVLCSTALLFRR